MSIQGQLENIVYVYNKDGKRIAQFEGDTSGLSEEAMQNLMVCPTVRIEQNGVSTLTFQMLANCQKWQDIKDVENTYYLNGKVYTAINENSYEYTSTGNIRIVNVTLVETWYKLARQYHQIYNCGLYCYAGANFSAYVEDGMEIKIHKSDCYNAGNTISAEKALEQVRTWGQDTETIYSITSHNEEWVDCPTQVTLKYKYDVGDYLFFDMSTKVRTVIEETFSVDDLKPSAWQDAFGMVQLKKKPIPKASYIQSVIVNSTVVTTDENNINRYKTSDKEATFYYEGTTLSQLHIFYSKVDGETINYIKVTYSYCNLGTPPAGADFVLGYGAEVVDEHTVVILPKAKEKYKLTIDGVSYEDSQVVDSRGAVMPRGSAGYAMWAVLKNTGWKLGICDVLAKGFDASNDYGCFNVESDMKDTLTNIRSIQELYGGILVWDSLNNILHYRAENSDDYESYEDGFNDWTGYEFRLGKNMSDYPTITYDNDLVTKAYILGYNNLNIKAVNGGKSYVEDCSYTDKVYEGYLEQTLIYDTGDEGGQKQLLEWGKKELAKMCKPRMSISINCFDIRTVDGYEHEIFDVNDVVRVYYKETNTDVETYTEKRVTSWEYNAFANYECKVEVGDKKSNFVQVFKLVYKKSESTPTTNGSGNLSASDIEIENGVTLSDMMNMVIKANNENATAISGLKATVDNQKATNELFSTYSTKIDGITNSAYAGLITYADKEIARVELTAKNDYGSLSSSLADFKVEAGNTYATISSVTEVKTDLATTKTSFQQTSDELSASIDLKASVEMVDEKTGEAKKATAELRTDVYGDTSSGKMGSIAELDNKIESNEKEISANYKSIVDLESATSELTTKYNAHETSIKSLSDDFKAVINLSVSAKDVKSYIELGANDDGQGWIAMKTQANGYSTIAMQSDGNVAIKATNKISLCTMTASGEVGQDVHIDKQGIWLGTSSYFINDEINIGGMYGLVLRVGSDGSPYISMGNSGAYIHIGGSSGINISPDEIQLGSSSSGINISSSSINLGGGTLTIGSTAGTSYFTSSKIRLGGSSGVNITSSRINIGSNSYFTSSYIQLGGTSGIRINSDTMTFGCTNASISYIDTNTLTFSHLKDGEQNSTLQYHTVKIDGVSYTLLGL